MMARGNLPAMKKRTHFASPFQPEGRKYRRFNLQFPVRVKVHSADSVVELEAITTNVSMGGLLLQTSAMIPQHTAVNFIMTVKTVHPVQLVGEGTVVRVNPADAEALFAVAVECKHPLVDMEDNLAATG
jgi:hypothetical protein